MKKRIRKIRRKDPRIFSPKPLWAAELEGALARTQAVVLEISGRLAPIERYFRQLEEAASYYVARERAGGTQFANWGGQSVTWGSLENATVFKARESAEAAAAHVKGEARVLVVLT